MGQKAKTIAVSTYQQTKKPFFALLGAFSYGKINVSWQ
ncbi:hypothetical protein AAUPMC_19214 [Pasteurella multocida subsp. multocida str. Anand1_cattle]|nr:hypothetical protein AAUPMC_19214 [Pasteurella multocida subsp. multocida str. Anand1_cattle]